MPYLNLDLDYFDHPKTLQLVALLGDGSDSLPLRLWAYAGKYAPRDGVIGKRSPAEVEALIRWRGEMGLAARALQRVGFLSRAGGVFKVHDWRHHQGHIWALKIKNRKVAQKRWANIRKSGSAVEKQASTTGTPGSESGIPQSVQSVPSVPDRVKQQVVKDRKDLTDLIASVGFTPSELEEHKIPHGMSRDGDVRVIDLEASRCQWYLDNYKVMDAKTTAALRHRIKIKAQEGLRK